MKRTSSAKNRQRRGAPVKPVGPTPRASASSNQWTLLPDVDYDADAPARDLFDRIARGARIRGRAF